MLRVVLAHQTIRMETNKLNLMAGGLDEGCAKVAKISG
jgi:hypothetical protein